MKIIFFVLGFFLAFAGNSQSITPSVINTTGGSNSNGSFSLEWSIGEIALVHSMVAPNDKFMVTNGFLQPDKFDQLQAVQTFTKEEVILLPNPTKGKVEIWINTRQQGALTLSVHDAAGKELVRKKLGSFNSNLVERIDLTDHPAGSYFVTLSLNPFWHFQAKQGTYRIVKI